MDYITLLYLLFSLILLNSSGFVVVIAVDIVDIVQDTSDDDILNGGDMNLVLILLIKNFTEKKLQREPSCEVLYCGCDRPEFEEVRILIE